MIENRTGLLAPLTEQDPQLTVDLYTFLDYIMRDMAAFRRLGSRSAVQDTYSATLNSLGESAMRTLTWNLITVCDVLPDLKPDQYSAPSASDILGQVTNAFDRDLSGEEWQGIQTLVIHADMQHNKGMGPHGVHYHETLGMISEVLETLGQQ